MGANSGDDTLCTARVVLYLSLSLSLSHVKCHWVENDTSRSEKLSVGKWAHADWRAQGFDDSDFNACVSCGARMLAVLACVRACVGVCRRVRVHV
jgi:hypothetical protein